MSIWCSHPEIGFDTFEPTSEPNGGQVRSFAGGWSNHYPTTDGTVEQPVSIDIASIAPWCVPGHEDEHDVTGVECGPWLRLGVNAISDGIVVMDEGAVTELVAQLTAWLDTPKVYPVTQPTEAAEAAVSPVQPRKTRNQTKVPRNRKRRIPVGNLGEKE